MVSVVDRFPGEESFLQSVSAARSIRVFGEGVPHPPLAPLHVDTDADDRFNRWQNQSTSGFPIKCYLSSEIVVSGQGLLWAGERVIGMPDLMPPYWRQVVNNNSHSNPDADAALPIRDIDEPCISVIGWGHSIYGHVLIEALTRLLMALRLARHERVPVKVLLRDDSPEWVRGMYVHAGLRDEDFVYFAPTKERVRLLNGIFPAYAYRGAGFHPATADLLGDLEGLENPEKQSGYYFLSRQLVTASNGGRRACVNEDRLVEIAKREFGFEIVSPEKLSWAEQVALFRGAVGVAGLYGSALHTAILAGATLRVGMVGMINAVQMHIGALKRQRQAYQLAGFSLGNAFSVPEDGFRRMLEGVRNE